MHKGTAGSKIAIVIVNAQGRAPALQGGRILNPKGLWIISNFAVQISGLNKNARDVAAGVS